MVHSEGSSARWLSAWFTCATLPTVGPSSQPRMWTFLGPRYFVSQYVPMCEVLSVSVPPFWFFALGLSRSNSNLRSPMVVLSRACLILFPVLAVHAASFPPFDPDDTHNAGLAIENWEITPKQWKFFGDSKAGTHTGSAIMTEENVNHQGRIWSRKSFTQSSWVIEFAFKMHGDIPDSKGVEVGNEGLAFWITEERNKAGPLFGSASNFTGVGIFFDTHDDDDKHDNPIIMGVQSDGSKELSPQTDFKKDRFGGCRAKYRNRNSMVRAKLKYTSGEDDSGGHLQLWLSMLDKGHYDVCFAKVYSLVVSGIDGVNLRCGTDKSVKCRLGFSTANRPSAKTGDAVTVSDLKIWDLGEQQRAALKRDLADKERLRKRNDMNQETQEMLENVDQHVRKVGDQLMENLFAEVKRDRLSKKKEFDELHEHLNFTLAHKGPINKKDVKKLLNDIKEVGRLAKLANGLMSELRKGRADDATKSAEKNSKDLMDVAFNGRQDLRVLHHQARTAQDVLTKQMREAVNEEESRSWMPYLLGVQAFVAAGLVIYKKKTEAEPLGLKSHLV